MLMADYGLGLWGGCADFEPIENDNMSIDLDSFMDLLQEEPTHAQVRVFLLNILSLSRAIELRNSLIGVINR